LDASFQQHLHDCALRRFESNAKSLRTAIRQHYQLIDHRRQCNACVVNGSLQHHLSFPIQNAELMRLVA
jgi:hypothetical protein